MTLSRKTPSPLDLLERQHQAAQVDGPSPVVRRPDLNLSGAGYRQMLEELRDRPDEPLVVYVHVPFCRVRCLYCACATTITHSIEKVDRYLDTLEREIAQATSVVGRGRRVDHLHVGGGTPNHLTEPQLVRLMEIIDGNFTLTPETNASVECNPRRTSAGQLDLLHGLGFRRISFGVQDLNPDVQRAIGRVHSLQMVRDVYLTARDTGFGSINLDLVYGLPFQTPDSYVATLQQVIELAPDRVSCFGYTHDPVNRPHQHAIDSDSLPTADEKRALFETAVEWLTGAGYHWVGLDIFVRNDDPLYRAQAAGRLFRNAIGYTAMPAHPVLGFGPSGFGEFGPTLAQNLSNLAEWQQRVEAGHFPIAWGRRLTPADYKRRDAMLYLVCNARLPASYAADLGELYERLCANADLGLVEVTPDGIEVTSKGRYSLHSLVAGQGDLADWGSSQRSFKVMP